MSYREVYNSTTVPMDGPFPDMYIGDIITVFSHQVPRATSPSGVIYVLKGLERKSSDGNWFNFYHWRWDAGSGNYIDKRLAGNGLLTDLRCAAIYDLPGSPIDLYAETPVGRGITFSDLSTYECRYTENYKIYSPSQFPQTGYWGGTDATDVPFMYDPTLNRFCQSNSQTSVGVYEANTGDFIHSIPVNGSPTHMANLTPPYMMCVNGSGIITFLDYYNGVVTGIGKLPDIDTGSETGPGTKRLVTYDRYMHRILLVDMTPTNADYTSTIKIRGFSLVPRPHGILPPMVNKEPQVDKRVKIFTRVIGQAGEGLSDFSVTFSDEDVGEVAPQVVVTDRYGYAEAVYDGLSTGGAETITVSVESDEDFFTPSTPQGEGAALDWEPSPFLDFNNIVDGQSVAGVADEMVNWDLGTDGFGAFADQSVKLPTKTSSAELRIEIGEDGQPSASNGTFGGDILIPSSDTRVAGKEIPLWVGAWMYFPTGFDFSTSTGFLPLFTVYYGSYISCEIELKETAGAHVGWKFNWPNQTLYHGSDEWPAHSNALIQPDTWHFIQYFQGGGYLTSNTNFKRQRLWLDDTLIWEAANGTEGMTSNTDGTYLEGTDISGIYINAATSIWSERNRFRILSNWPGGAPATQSCYIQNVVWTRDTEDALPLDADGNKYIPRAWAENL